MIGSQPVASGQRMRGPGREGPARCGPSAQARLRRKEILTDERLVWLGDQGWRRARSPLCSQRAAAVQRNLERREVLRADELEVHLLRLGGCLAQDVDGQASSAAARAEWRWWRLRRSTTPGICATLLRNCAEELGAVGPCGVHIFANRNHDRHDVLGLIAELDGVHAQEGLNGCACGGHQQ